jgi:hypothetical protein
VRKKLRFEHVAGLDLRMRSNNVAIPHEARSEEEKWLGKQYSTSIMWE